MIFVTMELIMLMKCYDENDVKIHEMNPDITILRDSIACAVVMGTQNIYLRVDIIHFLEHFP